MISLLPGEYFEPQTQDVPLISLKLKAARLHNVSCINSVSPLSSLSSSAFRIPHAVNAVHVATLQLEPSGNGKKQQSRDSIFFMETLPQITQKSAGVTVRQCETRAPHVPGVLLSLR